MTSPDGVSWTAQTSAADNYWYGVTFGNGYFVAAATSGTGNRVMTSPDGFTWTSRATAVDNSWRGITFGDGKIIAVANTGNANQALLISISAENNSGSQSQTSISSEDAARAAAAKREAERQAARASITSAIKNSQDVTIEMFTKAEISGVTTSNISSVKSEIMALPESNRADMNTVLKIARKYEIVEMISSERVGSVYPNNLIEIGIISSDNKFKSQIMEALKNLPSTKRSNYEAIKVSIETKMAEIQARKDRLAAIQSKISSRRSS
jgi:hypothetical protein